MARVAAARMHMRPAWDPHQLLITRLACDVKVLSCFISEPSEITSLSGAAGLWEMLLPRVINTSSTSEKEKKANYPDNGVHSRHAE